MFRTEWKIQQVRTCLFKWLLDDIADWIGREYDDVIAVGSVNRLPIESVVNLARGSN